MPSKKSKTAPIIIHSNATFISPVKANAVAMQPEIKLQHVMLLGICFFIIIRLFFRLQLSDNRLVASCCLPHLNAYFRANREEDINTAT